MTDDRFDGYVRHMQDLIAEFGWAIQAVMGDEETVPFCYTVGLASKDLPELAVFGLPAPVAGAILNDLAARAVAGVEFGDGLMLHDVVDALPVMIVEVIDSTKHLTLANRIGRRTPADPQVRAWQVVFPDAQGRWPWAPESDVATLPLLGAVPDLG